MCLSRAVDLSRAACLPGVLLALATGLSPGVLSSHGGCVLQGDKAKGDPPWRDPPQHPPPSHPFNHLSGIAPSVCLSRQHRATPGVSHWPPHSGSPWRSWCGGQCAGAGCPPPRHPMVLAALPPLSAGQSEGPRGQLPEGARGDAPASVAEMSRGPAAPT